MITITTLQHSLVQARLYVAMRKAIKASFKGSMHKPITLYNRRGKPYLMVWHMRSSTVDGHRSGFYFQDMRCYNVTETVLKSLKA